MAKEGLSIPGQEAMIEAKGLIVDFGLTVGDVLIEAAYGILELGSVPFSTGGMPERHQKPAKELETSRKTV